MAEGRVPCCPDCSTELTPLRQRRTNRVALWCWKCERYLRPGEALRARREARGV